jgi:hypothetical protein
VIELVQQLEPGLLVPRTGGAIHAVAQLGVVLDGLQCEHRGPDLQRVVEEDAVGVPDQEVKAEGRRGRTRVMLLACQADDGSPGRGPASHDLLHEEGAHAGQVRAAGVRQAAGTREDARGQEGQNVVDEA